MPENTKISFSEWWKFERETISFAWKSTNKKSSAIWSLVSGMLMAFLQFDEGFKTQHETLVSIVNILGVAAVVLFVQFLFNLLRAAAIISKTDREKLAAQKTESISDLEIEFIPIKPIPAKKHPCQIRIRNKSSSKNADNLKVEIVSFKDELSAEHAKYYHPEFPYLLKLDSPNITINPMDSAVITAFYFESASKIQDLPQKFVAGFDVVKSTEKKYASFLEKNDYPIKFAASAGGMARVEKEFKITFSGDDGIGRVCLKPVAQLSEHEKAVEIQKNDKIVRKKIKDALAGFRIWIQDLHRKLDAISYHSYHSETQQKFEQDYLEMDNQAYRILHDKVGTSEAVSFADEEQIPKVIVPPNAQFDMSAFRDRWIDHKFMFNRLKHKSAQLEKAESKLDSKDFILPLDNSK